MPLLCTASFVRLQAAQAELWACLFFQNLRYVLAYQSRLFIWIVPKSGDLHAGNYQSHRDFQAFTNEQLSRRGVELTNSTHTYSTDSQQGAHKVCEKTRNIQCDTLVFGGIDREKFRHSLRRNPPLLVFYIIMTKSLPGSMHKHGSLLVTTCWPCKSERWHWNPVQTWSSC